MPLIYTQKTFADAAHDGNLALLKKQAKSWTFKKKWLNCESGGWAIITLATRKGYTAVVEFLITQGADINKKAATADKPALYYAYTHGHLEIARILEAAEATLPAIDIWSALCSAAGAGRIDVVKHLIATGFEIVRFHSDHPYNSPLYSAYRNGHPETVAVLEATGATLTAGELAECLREASSAGNLFAVTCLLATGKVDINDCSGEGNQSALMLSILHGKKDVFLCLLQRGASIDLVDSTGKTALDFARKRGDKFAINALQEHLKKQEIREIAANPWTIMDDESIACIRIHPEIERKTTYIFNFRARERTLISQNTASGAESLAAPQNFDDIGESVLREAWNAYTQQGGRAADESAVFSHCMPKKLIPLK